MSTFIYVAAPYEDALLVREVHARLRACGCIYTSTWAENARGAENFALSTVDELREITRLNDDGIDMSDAMLVIARPGAGGEMFAEVRYALERQIPVYWVGRRILSTFRPGVTLCESIDDAVARVTAEVAA
ncbi:hypothetical protein [Pendulispora albinea]|uniref:Nucleoside 2-deoxyribosyltransferase n=1 Tax=Pendulispora albinea TaxID=2741071 RepID=A0ABZ2LWS7_9BACT